MGKAMTLTDAQAIADAIGFLDQAEAKIRTIKLATTAITVDKIDAARIHCRATLADVRRAERALP
jgi:hypothetical protein